jgi:hypothetical protein
MDFLPLEIIFIIKSYLPLNIYYLTNKQDYICYNQKIISSLPKNNYKSSQRSYIRNLIRKDYYFILNIILDVKFDNWYKAIRIPYNGHTFPCYIDLLNYHSIEMKSSNCRKLIQEKIINKLGTKRINKKKFKRIRIINNKWNN